MLGNWADRLLLAAGHLGQTAKAACCLLPVGPFLLRLLLMRVLHDFALSRFWRGGNGRLNVNKISFHSHVVAPAAASSLACASAGWTVAERFRRRPLGSLDEPDAPQWRYDRSPTFSDHFPETLK